MIQPSHLVRVADRETGQVFVGAVSPDGVAPLRRVATMGELLRLGLAEIEEAMKETGAPVPTEQLRLLPPIDGGTEVWAAGVTYLASREARVEESSDREVYRRVYTADRPELFFKAAAWRLVTDGEPIGVREDSANSVPEPEVGLVLNREGELIGFTVIDDVSSRSIEGANPLYLPQAKVYDGSCAIGASIAPRWVVPDRDGLGIRMRILRNGVPMFVGESSTARMKRSFEELARHLFTELTFPDGVVLATGTSVVPPLNDTLAVGDVVEIDIDHLGSLVTSVAPASAVGAWLAARRADPALRYGMAGAL